MSPNAGHAYFRWSQDSRAAGGTGVSAWGRGLRGEDRVCLEGERDIPFTRSSLQSQDTLVAIDFYVPLASAAYR